MDDFLSGLSFCYILSFLSLYIFTSAVYTIITIILEERVIFTFNI